VYVRKVAPKGIAADAGVKTRELLLELDGHKLDRFGKTYRKGDSGPFAERMTIYDLAERIEIGKKIDLVVWRERRRVPLSVVFGPPRDAAHEYAVKKITEPVRQRIGYIMVGGVVFMDLALNHIELLVETNPTLINYFRGKYRVQPRVVVSAVLPESTLPADSVQAGELVTRANGREVGTLSELQAVIDKTLRSKTDKNHPENNWLTIETSENSLVVFDLNKADTRHGFASHAVGHAFGPNGPKHRRRRHRRRRRGRHGRRRRGERKRVRQVLKPLPPAKNDKKPASEPSKAAPNPKAKEAVPPKKA